MRKWLIVLVLLLSPSVCLAADEEVPAQVVDIPPGEDVIESVAKGKPAPFDGQLFSPDTALRWSNWLLQYQARLKSDVEYERKVCAAELLFKSEALAIEQDKSKTIIEDQRARMVRLEQINATLQDDMNNPSWFDSVEFGLVLGVVGSAIVAAAVGGAIAAN